MRAWLFLLKFLFVGIFFIISNNDLNLGDEQEREIFFDYFISWAQTIFNQAKDITGYIIKNEWLPSNITNN